MGVGEKRKRYREDILCTESTGSIRLVFLFFFFCPPYDYMANDGCAIARRATSADCKLNLGLHYIVVHYIYSILYIRL